MNKAANFKSFRVCNFIPNTNGLFYITCESQVLEVKQSDKVSSAIKVNDKREQLWIRGYEKAEGYVTFKALGSSKFLTAKSQTDLIITGM